MFQRSEKEVVELNRSQFVTGSQKHRDPRSRRAVTVKIEIMRAFVKLRQLLASNTELARRFDELESKYDKQFKIVFDAIRQLMAKPV